MSQAETWAGQISAWKAIAGQPIMNAVFLDGSVLVISTQSNQKKLGTDSLPGSLAHQFAAALRPKTGFRIEIKGLVFTFQDKSSLEVGLEGSTIYYSGDAGG